MLDMFTFILNMTVLSILLIAFFLTIAILVSFLREVVELIWYGNMNQDEDDII